MRRKAIFIANLMAISTATILPGEAKNKGKLVYIDGLGKVPQAVVISCEQGVGDGGHETFFDEDWEKFSDCVNENMRKK